MLRKIKKLAHKKQIIFDSVCGTYIVPERKLSFSPISAAGSNFNSRNTQCIPAVNPAMAGSHSLI